MSTTKVTSYINGNTKVSIFSDGTKIREFEGEPKVIHPESIDVKITNYCDLGCKYCHESSTTEGKHADLDKLLEVLSVLPAGVELAIGGGNPLSHPKLQPFLAELKTSGFLVNITVNQGHLKTYMPLLIKLLEQELIYGIGISITSNNFKYVKELNKYSDNIVYHLIAGINNINVINDLIKLGNPKILLLGYKLFGFGTKYYTQNVKANIDVWKKIIRNLLRNVTISFDNLALEQLDVKKHFTKEGWEEFYMGDDFKFTMYIDAVNQNYAQTSRSLERTSFSKISLLKYFNL